MIEMLRAFAILQIFTVLFSVSGMNLFSHICTKSNTVSISFNFEADACSDHDCCENDITSCETEDKSCCSDHKLHEQVENHHSKNNLKSTECCQDASKYLAMSSFISIEKIVKSIDISSRYTINYDLNRSFLANLTSNKSLSEKIDTGQAYILKMIKFIHHSSDFQYFA